MRKVVAPALLAALLTLAVASASLPEHPSLVKIRVFDDASIQVTMFLEDAPEDVEATLTVTVSTDKLVAEVSGKGRTDADGTIRFESSINRESENTYTGSLRVEASTGDGYLYIETLDLGARVDEDELRVSAAVKLKASGDYADDVEFLLDEDALAFLLSLFSATLETYEKTVENGVNVVRFTILVPLNTSDTRAYLDKLEAKLLIIGGEAQFSAKLVITGPLHEILELAEKPEEHGIKIKYPYSDEMEEAKPVMEEFLTRFTPLLPATLSIQATGDKVAVTLPRVKAINASSPSDTLAEFKAWILETVDNPAATSNVTVILEPGSPNVKITPTTIPFSQLDAVNVTVVSPTTTKEAQQPNITVAVLAAVIAAIAVLIMRMRSL